jgi:UDP-N-acetylmuramoyl-L-alanyl-D-glutamate--2,6-diaminopimelate ligase
MTLNIKLGMKAKIEKLFTERKVKEVSFDSKTVSAGAAFFAMRGARFNGNDFIDEALRKNAGIVFTDDARKDDAKTIFFLEDIRLGLALAASILYPGIPENLIAVTGTNGKSSVVSYVRQILSLLGVKSASMGTLGVTANVPIPDELIIKSKNLTTNDPVNFRKILSTLNKLDIQNIAFEASSHGLHQKRLGDIKAKSAAFVSFSQDHLDYHGTMENYLNSKLKLFSENLSQDGEVVIHSEIMYFNLIKKFLNDKKISYTGVGQSGNIKVTANKNSLAFQEIDFRFLNKDYRFRTNIIGSFQAINILIAAKLIYNIKLNGVSFSDIVKTLPKLEAVQGRLQRVTKPCDDYQVFIDYAHTPDALKHSLNELKNLKPKNSRLHIVFGCGGNRDSSKRPIMGQVAATIADKVIITDDNPRFEDPEAIRQAIKVGAERAKIIKDRKEAIIETVNDLKSGDLLLIAGKGHENYQIIGDKVKHFSDFEVASEALKNRKNNNITND